MKKLAFNGSVHSFLDLGQGDVLLFVHGFPLDGRMWRRQAEAFMASHRVLVPDLRGFGQTPLQAGVEKVTMDEFARDLASLLDALGVAEPVTLVGLSMGGYVALAFWKRYPQRLNRLALVHTRAAADSPESAKGRHETATKVMAEGLAVLERAMLPKLLPETATPAVLMETKQMIHASSREGAAAALRGMAQRSDFRAELPSIGIPTLVLAGEHDGIATPTEMAETAKAIPGSSFVTLPGVGHLSPLESPTEFNSALAEFAKTPARR